MSETRMPRVGQVKEITSLANPIVKDIKALALKKFRDEQHAFMAEGLKLVIDALEGGWTIRTLIYSKAGRGNASVEKIASRTVALGGLVLEVSEKVLGAITRRDNPQMVVGVFEQKLAKLADIRLEAGDVWVALDRVRDPGNLGTIIRTVDAVGARGVILVGETTDPFSLETVRATMGSVFSVPIARATPEAFLGYDLGDRFTPAHRVVDYVEAVAAASPLVSVERYGVTVEGRPLLVAIVAESPQVAEAARLSQLAATRGEGTPEKAVVWLSYNVHGDEAVSTEAAMRTLYRLTQPDMAGVLAEAVVVLDPLLNPDGRERYVQGYRQRRGAIPNADPDSREHDQPWPGGRYNHYLFDLNRDWAWGTQPETRARLALYNRWLPAVHVDFHEQGVESPYYFAPAAEPFHPRILPWQRELQTAIGEANAAVFDREGWLYFTKEVFDLFYPGYGDTWPTFNGAVGMTYEQGGSGWAGLTIETAEGDTLTLADRIAGHTATGLETVRTVARNAAAVTASFADGFRQRAEGAAAYVAQGDPGRLAALAALLELQGIDYGWAAGGAVEGVRYGGGLAAPAESGRVEVETGALVVSTDQPKGRLAAVLFEPEPALRDSVTYDATAWALPYVYGLEGVAAEAEVATGGPAPEAPTVATGRPYAYVAEWSAPGDARLLARLLREGVGVRVVPEPFEADGRR